MPCLGNVTEVAVGCQGKKMYQTNCHQFSLFIMNVYNKIYIFQLKEIGDTGLHGEPA